MTRDLTGGFFPLHVLRGWSDVLYHFFSTFFIQTVYNGDPSSLSYSRMNPTYDKNIEDKTTSLILQVIQNEFTELCGVVYPG